MKKISAMTWTELLQQTKGNPLWAASQLATMDKQLTDLRAAIKGVIDTAWLDDAPPKQAD